MLYDVANGETERDCGVVGGSMRDDDAGMLTKIDHWLGRKIMQPPIIWFCQVTNTTQYAVARYAWMLAAWTLIMRISFEGWGDWIFSILVILLSIRETALAAIGANTPSRSNDGLRKVLLLLVGYDLAQFLMQTEVHGFTGFHWGLAWDAFALVGEYAKTIGTIPPRRTHESKRGQDQTA